VSTIIVNYNGAEFLGECLRSVFEQPYRPVEVIVVDNGSSDSSTEIVRRAYPKARLISNSSNIGFAQANNQGVEAASGEFVVLLNNDSTVEQEWLSALVAAVARPRVAVVTSKVITDGVPTAFYEMNGTLNFVGYNIMRAFADLSQVFFAGGASLVFRKDVVGMPFPGEYFLYQEDVYLSWKMRLLGYDVRMAQESIIHHRGSATTRREAQPLVTFYQERNRLLNCLLMYERKTLLLLLPYFVGDLLLKLMLSLLVGRKSFAGILRGYAWIIRNRPWVRGERRKVQSARKVPDREVMRLMSSRVFDADNLFARFCNALSMCYARLAGLSYYD
jgi:GT2 family glycosyltransferase